MNTSDYTIEASKFSSMREQFHEPIDPQAILSAFAAAGMLMSMSEGPASSHASDGTPYTQLLHDGTREEGEPLPYLIRQCPMEEFRPLLRDLYLSSLIGLAASIGANAIEWRVWPKIGMTADQLRGAVYSRLHLYRIDMSIKHTEKETS